jgi:hypothetical protein
MVNMPNEQRSVLLIVLEKDNLERMKTADPVTLESRQQGGGLPPPKYPTNFSILIGYDEDQDTLYAMAKAAGKTQEGMVEFFKYLERGRKFIEGVDGVKNFRKA